LHLQLPKGLDIGSTSFYGRDTALLAETGQHLARFAFTWDAGISSANYRISILIGPAGGSIAEVSSINFNTGGGTNADVIDTDFADPSDTVRVTINPAGGVDPTTDTVWCSIMAMRLMATLYDVDGNEIVDPAEYTTNYYTADQIVADLLGRLLDKYDGAGASIAACTHQVNQLSYPDGTTAEQVLNDLMTLESGYYWKAGKESATNPGTYEFTWKAWPTTIRYESHSRDGLDSPGSLQELYNAVTVRWRDPIGRIRRTRRTQTVDALTDAGLTREALIDLGDEVGSVENAEQAGDEFLAAHLYAPNAGRLTVRHPIVDFERGRMVQPWEVEPGGLLRITDIKPRFDALSPTARDGVSVFRVTAVDYDAGSNTATLELDSPPRTIENLIGRMATAPDKRRR
jgi:hypothetical protein